MSSRKRADIDRLSSFGCLLLSFLVWVGGGGWAFRNPEFVWFGREVAELDRGVPDRWFNNSASESSIPFPDPLPDVISETNCIKGISRELRVALVRRDVLEDPLDG